MRAVDRSVVVQIFTKKILAGKVVQIVVVLLKFFERTLGSRVIVDARLVPFRKNPFVGELAIFNDENGNVRTNFPKSLNKRNHAFVDPLRGHVRTSVENIYFGVNLNQKVGD